MKKIILSILFICYSIASLSQKSIAKLDFEEAEEAYNNGKYNLSLEKLADAEKNFGKINIPIFYLRILNEDKLISAKLDLELILELKNKCKAFLKEYENQEGIEDKYRDVYKILGKYRDYPDSNEAILDYKKKIQEKNNADELLIQKIENQSAIAYGGKENMSKITSLYKKSEMVDDINPNLRYIVEVKIIKNKKFFQTVYVGNSLISKILYDANGQSYYYRINQGSRNLTEFESYEYKLATEIFNDYVGVQKQIQQSSLNGVDGYYITYQLPYYNLRLFYNSSSGLYDQREAYDRTSGVLLRKSNIKSRISKNNVLFLENYEIIEKGENNYDSIKVITKELKTNIEFKEKDFK